GAEAKIRRGRLLREILKQERLNPLPASFQLAWMIAFNAGLLDAFAPEDLPGALQKLLDGIAHESLALDTPRDEWLTWLKNRLGLAP
ncbi:MAG: hypothetical protein AB7E55_29880, partial [Pigmentiphaga sp.]